MPMSEKMLKQKIIFFLFSIFLGRGALSATILIDPGHGGEDEGAKRELFLKNKKIVVKEKDLAMMIGKKIYQKLKQKKYNVFLTRSYDRTVTLADRSDMAEKLKADLFISVHMNSSSEGSSQGFETYYLDNNNNKAVEKVEKEENERFHQENVNNIIEHILVDLVIDRTVEQSKKLSFFIHQAVKSQVGTRYQLVDRKVRPGFFYVLALSKRPSVLLETGFLSHPIEGGRLNDEAFQENYASAVANGIELYIKTQNIK